MRNINVNTPIIFNNPCQPTNKAVKTPLFVSYIESMAIYWMKLNNFFPFHPGYLSPFEIEKNIIINVQAFCIAMAM